MESEIVENKFELSVLGALEIILVYNLIIPCIVKIPFIFISKTMYSNTHEVFKSAVIVLGELFSNIIMVRLILKKIRKDCEINFKVKYIEKFNFKILLCIIFLMIGFLVGYQSSIGVIIGKIPMPQFIEKEFAKLFIDPYLMAISGIIIAPIFEEILMRGIILEGFLNKYKPKNAIIASSLIFGLVHLNIPQFINAAFLGMIFGIIYYKTRSLVLCIAAHMLNNTIASINFQLNIISFIIGIVIFIISGIFFVRYIKRLTFDKVNFEEGKFHSET